MMKHMKIFNYIFYVFIFAIKIILTVNSQPLANPVHNLINSFIEELNPAFRRHRARLRPYRQQFGSPMISERDTEKFGNDSHYEI